MAVSYTHLDVYKRQEPESTEINISMNMCMIQIAVFFIIRCQMLSLIHILPKIFRRFYRSELVKDEEGVGIGLYLTREILQEQGGYIKVSSVYGQGSKFSIYLPKNNF